MALISYTKPDESLHYQVILWEGATNGGTPDTFQAYKLPKRPYSLTFQIEDADSWAAATGPNMAIHGSIDGSSYYVLQNGSQSDINVTADDFISVGEAPLFIKPVLTNGDSGTDITVRMLVWFDSQ